MARSARSHTGAKCLSLVAGALIVFHVWILWERFLDLSLFQTGVALHWILAAAIFGLGAWLRWQGVNLLRGRQAVVFWMLVLLLHFAGTTPLPESVASGLDFAREASFHWLIPASAAGLLVYAAIRGAGRVRFSRPIPEPGLAYPALQLALAPPRNERHAWQRFSRPPPFFPHDR